MIQIPPSVVPPPGPDRRFARFGFGFQKKISPQAQSRQRPFRVPDFQDSKFFAKKREKELFYKQ